MLSQLNPFTAKFHRRIACLLAICGVIYSVGLVRADESLTRFYEGLRSRGLYDLAERGCLERLAEESLSSDQRAELTLELARTFAAHAMSSTGDEQADLWKRAEDSIAGFLKTEPKHPRGLLLEAQLAFLPAAEAEAIFWQLELAPEDNALRQRGLAASQSGIGKLTLIEQKLAEYVRNPPRRPKDADSIPPIAEFRGTLYQVRYQLATALLNQSQLLPSSSPDRSIALLAAEDWLEPLAGGFPGEAVTLQSMVSFAKTARLRGDPDRANRILDTLEKETLSNSMQDELVAERARVALASGDPGLAAQLLTKFAMMRPLSPELTALRIEVLLVLWKEASTRDAPELVAQLREAIEKETGRLEPGDYWAVRTKLRLERTQENQEYGAELAGKVRQAALLYHENQIPESLASYAAAATLARKQSRPDLAFQMDYTRASILLNQQSWEEAAKVFRELAESSPGDSRSPDADLLGVYALGRFYDERPTKTRRLNYTQALETHRSRYAELPTATEATWMLALLQERRLQATAALELYKKVPKEHPRRNAAEVGVARCYEKLLNRLHELGHPSERYELEALQTLQEILPNEGTYSLEQAEIALRLSRILLNLDDPQYPHADEQLARLLQSDPTLDSQNRQDAADDPAAEKWSELRSAATKMRVLSLAGQRRVDEAETLLQDLTARSPHELIPVLDGLSQLVSNTSAQARKDVATLQLAAALKLQEQRDRLEPEDRIRLSLCLAEAFAANDQTARAITVYEALLKASPNDADLLRRLAERLNECDSPDCLARRVTIWKQIEESFETGTDNWVEARFQVAQSLFASGDRAGCLKLVGVTRLLYPKAGTAAMRKQLEELEAACRKTAP